MIGKTESKFCCKFANVSIRRSSNDEQHDDIREVAQSHSS